MHYLNPIKVSRFYNTRDSHPQTHYMCTHTFLCLPVKLAVLVSLTRDELILLVRIKGKFSYMSRGYPVHTLNPPCKHSQNTYKGNNFRGGYAARKV